MRILAVDDVLVIRKLIRRVVESMGEEFLEAANGIDALDMIQRDGGGLDLILLDWNMPGMNGMEFLSRMKSNDKLRRIPVIMVSAENEKGKIIEAIKAGVVNYLVKPFSEQELARKILECLGLGYEHEMLNRLLFRATRSVLAKITGQDVQSGDGGEAAGQEGNVTGRILLMGQVNAVISLAMSEETAAYLASRIKGRDAQGLAGEQIIEGLAEFLGEIIAKTKLNLENLNINWALAAPCSFVTLSAEGHFKLYQEATTYTFNYLMADRQLLLNIDYLTQQTTCN